MCTNHRLTKAVTDIYAEFSQTRLPILLPRQHAAPKLELQYEIRPTNPAIVLRTYKNGVELTRMRWGLVRWFHRGPLKAWKLATFNAQAESIKTARSFRDAFERRRCLIAADGWVEWKGVGKAQAEILCRSPGCSPDLLCRVMGPL